MGQAQSDEGELPEDDKVVAVVSKQGVEKKTTTADAPASNKQKSDNNQRAFRSTGAKGHDSKQQGRYKRNLLAAATRGGSAAAAAAGEAQNKNQNNNRVHQAQLEQHVRKLSNVSNRNIQLLSMKPRNERDNFADGLRSRRRSSLINLILGAPSRGPRFSDDLCSLSSHMSELCNFGIDYFPDTHYNYQQQQQQCYEYGQPAVHRSASSIAGSSLSRLNDNLGGSVTLRPTSLALTTTTTRDSQHYHHYGAAGDFGQQRNASPPGAGVLGHRRRSSFGSLSSFTGAGCPIAPAVGTERLSEVPDANETEQIHSSPPRPSRPQSRGQDRPSLASIFMASIDLTDPPLSSNEHKAAAWRGRAPPLARAKQTTVSGGSGSSLDSLKSTGAATNDRRRASRDNHYSFGARIPVPSERAARGEPQAAAAAVGKGRINHNARRIIHRSGSELSLYSCASAASLSHNQLYYQHQLARHTSSASQGSLGSSVLEVGGCGQRRIVSRKVSSTSAAAASGDANGNDQSTTAQRLRHETKWIIMLQVCLPFILAGFGNMAAGLVLNKMAQWEAFRRVPIFFVLLPSFVGLKGNIEMTLASRLSTLANLSLLDTGHQRRQAFATNLLLIMGQAIGLSVFAAFTSVLCELLMGKLEFTNLGELARLSTLVVLPCALVTSVSLALVSSIVMSLAICLAHRLQVNPDNLSTLVAALYGDVSCVLTYGLFAQLMYSYHEQGVLLWPAAILTVALISWPLLLLAAYKSKETRDLSISSMPPMLTAIVVSLGSGSVLSLVVGRFSRIALYQPVVNGFGANLIAVQASRVSTWLWCNALRRQLSVTEQRPSDRVGKKGREFEFEPTGAHNNNTNKTLAVPYGSLASFSTIMTTSSGAMSKPTKVNIGWSPHIPGGGSSSSIIDEDNQHDSEKHNPTIRRLKRGLAVGIKLIKLLLWSFCNSSPNSVAARLLLVMLIPAHSLYFVVIWALAPPGYVTLTWLFYLAYIGLCLTQVFVLLLICEPLMAFLMSRHLDPDVFGISLLMALADLIGTLCLTGAFFVLAGLHDPNT